MFANEELDIIFKVFSTYEPENADEDILCKKMELLKEQKNISKEANDKLRELDNQIRKLYEVEDEAKEEK